MSDPLFDVPSAQDGAVTDLFDAYVSDSKGKPMQRVVQGRYRLPEVDESEPNPAYKRIKKWVGTDHATSWMRATRLASVIADSYALNMWRNRMCVKGVASILLANPELIALWASLDVRDDRADLEQIVEDAIRLADAVDRAAMGTAIHLATENADRLIAAVANGEPLEGYTKPDGQLIHHVVNWRRALLDLGIEIVAIEDIIAVAPLGVAGRLDRIGRTTEDIELTIGVKDPRTVIIPANTYVIVDLKTGKSLELAWHEISVQLAIYANHTHRFVDTPDGDGSLRWYAPMQINREVALVVHIPAMEGGAYVYGVDIEKGWVGAQLARGVANWHSQTGFSGIAQLR